MRPAFTYTQHIAEPFCVSSNFCNFNKYDYIITDNDTSQAQNSGLNIVHTAAIVAIRNFCELCIELLCCCAGVQFGYTRCVCVSVCACDCMTFCFVCISNVQRTRFLLIDLFKYFFLKEHKNTVLIGHKNESYLLGDTGITIKIKVYQHFTIFYVYSIFFSLLLCYSCQF